MQRKTITLTLMLLMLAPGALFAGGALETFDITAGNPSPIPGHIAADVVGIKWDARCIPVRYSMNDTLDPIPNPLGPAFLTLADAQAALQDAMDEWNDLRTSFIDMQIVNTVSNPATRGFDFVNEQTFRVPAGSGFIASSPSVSLIADSNLVDGDDVDGDGDSDVSNTISTCADVDGDGDVEFPEGFYEAGTILDNDVQYNADVLRFTVDVADIDTVTASVDLEGVAVHELGHSHGLSHVLNNQTSRFDGTATTMFPFIDTGDPDSELAVRSVDTDDVAFSSFFYPEGSDTSGPAALQPGDFPFDFAFGLIEGEVTHGGQNFPLAGASVSAERLFFGSEEATAFSGTTRLSFDPATGGLFLVDPTFNIVDGKYTMPVPFGLYKIGVEAVDGQPVPSASVSFTTQIGDIFGQHDFNEEFYNGRRESALEAQPGQSSLVLGLPLSVRGGIDMTTNVDASLASFGTLDFIGFTGAAPLSYYAVAFPAADIAALSTGAGDLSLHTGLFRTGSIDASVVPIFAEASLAVCEVSGGAATIDLDHPLRRDHVFVGQDTDFAPFYFSRPQRLAKKVLQGIADGDIENLCLVLQVPDAPFPGVNATPPVIGLDGVPGGANDVPIAGLSFTSDDGVIFTASTDFNFMFALAASEVP